MRRPPEKRTDQRAARGADAVYVHAPGRETTRLSKRRLVVVAATIVSAVAITGFTLGFFLHAVGHG